MGVWPRPLGLGHGLGGVVKSVRANPNPNPNTKAVGAQPRPWGKAKDMGEWPRSWGCGQACEGLAKAVG